LRESIADKKTAYEIAFLSIEKESMN
jgi:hypothetical protein